MQPNSCIIAKHLNEPVFDEIVRRGSRVVKTDGSRALSSISIAHSGSGCSQYLRARAAVLSLGLLSLGLLVPACAVEGLGGLRWPCSDTSECPSGQVCGAQGICETAGTLPDNETYGILPDKLVLGLNAPLSGPDAALGEQIRAGMEAYFAQVNESGGVHGRKLELAAFDNRGDDDLAVAQVSEVVEKRNVFALVGSAGGDMNAIALLANEQKLPLLGAFSGAPALHPSEPSRYVFNLRSSLQSELDNLLRFVGEIRQPAIPPTNIALFVAADSKGQPSGRAGEVLEAALDALNRRAGITSSAVKWLPQRAGEAGDVGAAAGEILAWIASSALVPDASGGLNALVVLAVDAAAGGDLVRAITDELVHLRRRRAASGKYPLSGEQVGRLLKTRDVVFASSTQLVSRRLAASLESKGLYARDDLGATDSYCSGLLGAQVVPDVTDDLAAATAFRTDLGRSDSTRSPDETSFEGYLVARWLVEALRKHGAALEREGFIGTLEQLVDLDLGVGQKVSYSSKDHEGLSQVWATMATRECDLTAVPIGSLDAAPPPPGSDELCTDGTCVLSGTITSDLTLSADRRWLLRGIVRVGDGETPVVLTIAKGTTVLGEYETNGTLVVSRFSRLEAAGTAESPIVFTSARPAGQRRRGDWGGLILSGRAEINECGGALPPCQAEGPSLSGIYGGNVGDDNSGTLRYVRVEFAGRPTAGERGAALLLQGVGRLTALDHLQVHRSGSDGFAFQGGAVRMKYGIATGSAGVALSWNRGWSGALQFFAGLQYEDAGSGGIDGANNDVPEQMAARPVSSPSLANITLVGHPSAPGSATGVLLRAGTLGTLYNLLALGWQGVCLDLEDEATFAQSWDAINGRLTGALEIESSLVDCATNFQDQTGDLYRPEAFFLTLNSGNREANPKLFRPYTASAPDLRPQSDSPALGSGLAAEGSWYTATDYIGAMGTEDWSAGWTQHAAN